MTQIQTEAPALSQWQRVGDVFVAPSATFADIRRSASWWLPYLIIAFSVLVVSFSIGRKVGFPQVVENQIHQSASQESQINSLDSPARAARLSAMATGYRYTSYAYPLMVLAFAALGSLVLWATFNFALGAQTTYAQIFAVWMYANLPRVFSALVTTVTLWFGGSPENFNLQQPAGTNPGYYMTESPQWMRVLFSYFDVVGIWVLVLLIVGTAIVARVKVGRAAAVVIGWWLLVLVVSVSATAAFQ
ncbi:MAG: YIP1 family protein [Acidobacteriota bacterium]|nr:YIP1 family protein [Acidobacteriota bacterium]